MKLSLDIIIVNWNAGEQLASCLTSIVDADHMSFKLDRVVIVDNASTDESLARIGYLDLPLQIIRNKHNKGFAAACNQGAQHSNADYLLFLNPDTKLFHNSLSESIAFMENLQNQHIGICGIKLLDDDGAIAISAARFPTLRILAGNITGLSKLLPGLFPAHLMLPHEINRSGDVDQVIGAFFLIRKKLFEELNGFDEQFFVYYEEVDFSLRAKNLGYTSYYLSDVNAYHKGGGSSEQIRATRLFYSLRSRVQYAHKHYSRCEFVILVLLTFTVEIASRILRSLYYASWTQILEVLRGYKQLVAYFINTGWRNEHC